MGPTLTGGSTNSSGLLVNAYPGLQPPVLSYSEEDKKEVEYEQEYRETFSRSILKQRMMEYQGGKYTKKYMETYLDFIHMSGFVSNLEYLEYKEILSKE